MKKICLIIIILSKHYLLFSQDNLQDVTQRGNTTTTGIYANGQSSINGVSFSTTDIYYKDIKAEGYNFNLVNGAGDGKLLLPFTSLNTNARFINFGLSVDKNLGIGTINPQTLLQIGEFNNGGATNQLSIPGTYNFEQLRLGQIGNGNQALEFVNHNGISSSYGIKLLVNVDQAPGLQMQYASPQTSYNALSYQTGLYLNLQGNVGIGTLSPAERLSVNGKIRAKEIKVETANWPDYVFEDRYELKELETLEEFIKVNKHLPDIPSAKEAEENGINLGDMNGKLLKKVEELTLYVIDQNKKLERQEKLINLLLKKNDLFEN